MGSLRATSSFRGANRAHLWGDVRDAESLAWNDYLAFFVIPSLPRNPAKRKNIINAPTAGFSGLRYRSTQNDIKICHFLPSGF